MRMRKEEFAPVAVLVAIGAYVMLGGTLGRSSAEATVAFLTFASVAYGTKITLSMWGDGLQWAFAAICVMLIVSMTAIAGGTAVYRIHNAPVEMTEFR